MDKCLFCEMASGKIKPKTVSETEELLAFRDINPRAPVHILIVPRKHIASINELTAEDAGLVGRMVLLAQSIARQEGVAESGYRLTMNCNPDGGQTVFHLHMHLLGGRQMEWPPG